jgi:uncharacterized membrane protein
MTVGLAIEMVAIAVVVIGVLQTLIRMPGLILRDHAESVSIQTWLVFARWLVAALTFQLAADIVHTTVTPSWTEIGRVAAIALIRTFLTVALSHDLVEARAERISKRQGYSAVDSTSS